MAITFRRKIPPSTPFQERIWILPPHLQEMMPFFLDSAGMTLEDANYHIRRRNGAKYYVLECILAGRGELTVAGLHFEPAAGDVYLLPAGVPNEYRTDRKSPWRKIWFNLSGELVESLLTCYQLDGVIYLRQANLEGLFLEGLKIVQEGASSSSVAFAGLLTKLLATMGQLHHREMHLSTSQQIAQVAREYLDNHWKDPYSLASLSQACGKSASQVMRGFRDVWHCTPKAYHTTIRFRAAERYLKSTVEPLKTIANWLQFANEFQFSAWFKKQSGLSPRQFRCKEGVTHC